jgi:hypothetical protein
MALLVGVLLAAAVLGFTCLVGFERERGFYPVMLIAIATYYDLFAVMSGSTQALLSELVPTALFLLLCAVGYRYNLWLVAAGMVGHGLFDCIHGALIDDPGVPAWWPPFCMTFDVAAGGFFAWRLARRSPAGDGLLERSSQAP